MNSTFLFGATIFLSAFLLFEVQPLMAKLILPWFGGTAAVWTTCLLFFQVLLLGGYCYAHWLNSHSTRFSAWLHCGLLLLSTLSLPIIPAVRWKPSGAEDPIFSMVPLLLATVGLPYFLLSSTSSLLQTWYSRSSGGALPWRFFALSNLGSMLGLLSYPFLVEPWVANEDQVTGWSIAYAVFTILCAIVAWRAAPASAGLNAGAALNNLPLIKAPLTAPGVSDRLLWIGIAACTSALLLAISGYMTLNIAAAPLLWVLPLSLYLLSFILCFGAPHPSIRKLFVFLGLFALLAILFTMTTGFQGLEVLPLVCLYSACAFAIFMLLHAELAHLKPAGDFATSYYLLIAFGGALGSLLIAVAAPYFLKRLWDLPIVLGCCFLMCSLLAWRSVSGWMDSGSPLTGPLDWVANLLPLFLVGTYAFIRIVDTALGAGLAFVSVTGDIIAIAIAILPILYLCWRGAKTRIARSFIRSGAVTVTVAILALFVREAGNSGVKIVRVARNMYGALTVFDAPNPAGFGMVRSLGHGAIVHGEQFAERKDRLHPTAYYARASGIGRTLETLNASQAPLKVGVVGLGAGTIAAYGRSGDEYVFYEINPQVKRIAEEDFSFLRDTPARVKVILGDARLSLERQPPQAFDILALDAFSSDAIPVHLLTREAFQLYWRHLKPDGVVAVHVSNRFLSLAPVVLMAAFESGKDIRILPYEGNAAREERPSDWTLVSSRAGFFESPLISARAQVIDPKAGLTTWTDNYSNIYHILR